MGDRIRRLRNARRLSLVEMARLVHKPNQGYYSGGYFSRLERGWATAPLYVYIAIAEVLEVPPGQLLGPDAAQFEATDAELTLIRLMRRLGISPDDAIAQLVDARESVIKRHRDQAVAELERERAAAELRRQLAAAERDEPELEEAETLENLEMPELEDGETPEAEEAKTPELWEAEAPDA